MKGPKWSLFKSIGPKWTKVESTCTKINILNIHVPNESKLKVHEPK